MVKFADLWTLEEVVAALQTTRDAFERVFSAAQILRDTPVSFATIAATLPPALQTVGTESSDRGAYLAALEFARDNGFLEELLRSIFVTRLETGALTRKYWAAMAQAESEAEAAPPGAARANEPAGGMNYSALQASITLEAGFPNPDAYFRGMANGMRWTGKIEIEGPDEGGGSIKGRGTGILIAPHLVLTAWHVVRPLFEKDQNGRWVARPERASWFSILFDKTLVDGGPDRAGREVAPTPVGAGDDWCVAFSPCHPDELLDRLPSTEEDFWDYCIVKLKGAPGQERSWASLDGQVAVPPVNDHVSVFQFPDKQYMKVGLGSITIFNSLTADGAAAGAVLDAETMSRMRFLHSCNTNSGSSGGPCFDRRFTLFGIHQGEWVNQGNGPQAVLPNGVAPNRGIPVARIQEDLKRKIENLPPLSPEFNRLWNLGRPLDILPIIGSDDFQEIVWRSALAGSPQLLLITGGPGSGKSFKLDLLNAMLPEGDQLVINLDAQSLSGLDALGVVQLICSVANIGMPNIDSQEATNAALGAWLKDEVIGKLMQALQETRDGRLVWITVRQLNTSSIRDKSASELMFLLYEQVLTHDWLRIVLDGMVVSLPRSLNAIRRGQGRAWQEYPTQPLTADDIYTFLKRFFAAKKIQAGDETARPLARHYHRQYTATHGGVTGGAMGGSALQILADEIASVCKEFALDYDRNR